MRLEFARLTSALRCDERGQVMLTFGLSIIPCVMFVGGAIDFGNAYSARQKIQRAADAGVLAAVSMGYGTPEQDRKDMATNVFNSNVAGIGGIASTTSIDGNVVTLAAVAAYPTAFLKIAHIDSLNISGSAAGTVSYNSTTSTTTTETAASAKVCILALDPGNDVKGIAAQGTPTINYANCWAHTNSTMVGGSPSSGAIQGGGSGTVTGAGHGAVGGLSTNVVGVYSPAAVGNQAVIADPFATNAGGAYATSGTYTTSFTAPAIPSSCTGGTGLKLQKGTFTIYPGKYCNNLSIMAGATVNMMPGDYIIENGAFDVQSGATLTGNGVTLYFNQTNFSHNKYDTYFQVIGGGTVNLVARSTGWTTAENSRKGFLIIMHPNANKDGTSRIQGGGILKMEGMVYAPRQNIKITGNGDTQAASNANSDMFALVAKSFEFDGNGVFNLKKKGATTSLPDIVPTKQTTVLSESTTTTNIVSKVQISQ